MDTITPREVEEENLHGWAVVAGDVPHLCTRARTGSFSKGLEFVTQVGEFAEQANHHPDVELTYPQVTLSLTTHDAGGLTRADVDLARRISEVARDLSVELQAPPG